jgi:hypothetical protein
VSTPERACIDDEEVREGSRARQSRARVRRPILSISWRARVKRRCQSIAFPPRKKAGNAAATWRSDDRDFFPNREQSRKCANPPAFRRATSATSQDSSRGRRASFFFVRVFISDLREAAVRLCYHLKTRAIRCTAGIPDTESGTRRRRRSLRVLVSVPAVKTPQSRRRPEVCASPNESFIHRRFRGCRLVSRALCTKNHSFVTPPRRTRRGNPCGSG